MNFRLLMCIAMGVFTTYLGIFMLASSLHPRPRIAPRPMPNFSAKATTVVNAETGEKTTYREITVTTKFAPGAATPPPEKPQLEKPASGDAFNQRRSF